MALNDTNSYYSNLAQQYGSMGANWSGQDVGAYDQVLPGYESNASSFQNQANAQELAMSGGYSPQEQASILGLNSDGSGLSGVNTMSPSDIAALQANPTQASAILGNPQTTVNDTQANLNTLGQNVTTGNQNVTGAANTGSAALYGAADTGSNSILSSVDPNSIGLAPGYQAGINSDLSGEASALGAATSNPNLGLTQQYLQNYQFTPQDQQNIVSAAGEAAGGIYQAQNTALQMQAAASGETSPLAINAAEQANMASGAAAAGNAMTAAQNTALQTNLGVQQNLQQTQLGSAQDISSRQMQTAESLAGTQIGAAQNTQAQQIGAAEAGQGLGLSAAGQAANLGYGAASQAAQLGTGAAQYGATALNNATQYATGANQSANEYANNSSTAQNLALLQNQQNTQLTAQNQAYNQNLNVNNTMSGRYQGIAQQQQNQGNTYGTYLTGQTAANNSNYMQGLAGRQSAATQGAQAGLQGTAEGANYQGPSLFNTIVGGLSGAAQSATSSF